MKDSREMKHNTTLDSIWKIIDVCKDHKDCSDCIFCDRSPFKDCPFEGVPKDWNIGEIWKSLQEYGYLTRRN